MSGIFPWRRKNTSSAADTNTPDSSPSPAPSAPATNNGANGATSAQAMTAQAASADSAGSNGASTASPTATTTSAPPSSERVESTMMDFPLTLQHTLYRATSLFPDREIVTNTENGRVRTTYGAWSKRVNQLANALTKLGVQQGERVATLAWNNAQHLELYFAVPCMGAILHTLNLRLFPQDLAYVIQDAQDSYIFADADLLPLLERVPDALKGVKAVVVMNGPVPDKPNLPKLLSYEELLANEPTSFAWPTLDEHMAAAMCYTSGTTGQPKGVVYSHRSIALHNFALLIGDIGLQERDRVMPFVPMFHVNAWGIAHAAPMIGASLILPGRFLDPKSITQLMADERVTQAAGVPTIWIGLLQLLDANPGAYDLSACNRILCGGSAVPLSLIEGLDRHGLRIIQAWGMTETSPLASMGQLQGALEALPTAERNAYRAKQGVPVPMVELRIVDDSGNEVAHDGKAFGEIQVRGPWITGTYYHGGPSGAEKFTADGWLRTGDVATLDEHGYINIVDRTKDVIKSGGEWISSVNLENLIMGHPQVLEAAVIGVPDPKWQERPVAYVVPKPEFKGTLTETDILDYLRPLVAQYSKYWLPDRVIFIDEVPKTSVGKFDKKVLRARYAAEQAAQQSGQSTGQ